MKKRILTIAFGLLGISLSAQIPTNGLIGYYPFNNNINNSINSTYNLTGTIYSFTSDRFGNPLAALNSATNTILQTAIFSDLPSASYSLWIKTSNVQQPAGPPILTVGDASANGYALYLENPLANKVDVVCGGIAGAVTSSTFAVSQNQWAHIVMVKVGNQFTIFANGVQVSTGNSSYNPIIASNKFYLPQGTYSGLIDDVRIYNRAITSTEITSLFNESLCFQNITVTDTLIINTTITGFNPVTYKNTIKVWPNPTNDHIIIDNGNIANLTGYQIKITNSLSQQVFQSAITQQQFYVDLSTWTGNGIYFVHIIDGQGNTIDIKKIVLQ